MSERINGDGEVETSNKKDSIINQFKSYFMNYRYIYSSILIVVSLLMPKNKRME